MKIAAINVICLRNARSKLIKMENNLSTLYATIIIKNGQQCKAGRERLTPYQSEDPNPTIPTHRRKEEIGKTAEYKKCSEQLGQ